MSNGESKGLSPLAWVAIGCGALALLAFLGVAAVVGFGVFKAKQVIDDLEDGQVTFNTPEGEVAIDVSGEEGGSVKVTGPEGEQLSFGADASLENVPDWVPIYPDATQTQASFHTKNAEGVQGVVSVRTDDSPQDVMKYFKEWLENEGYEILGESTTNTPQGSFLTLSGELASAERTLNLGVIVHDEATQITINYAGKGE